MQEQVIVIPNSLVIQSPPPPLNSDNHETDSSVHYFQPKRASDVACDQINEDEDHPGNVEMFEISPPLNGSLKIDITLTPNIAGCSHQNPMFSEKQKSVLVQTAGTYM